MNPGFGDDDGPVVILTAARSGSTLLRFILDSHPELACPPEGRLGEACRTLRRLAATLGQTQPTGDDGGAGRVQIVDPQAVTMIREQVGGYYARYAEAHGKKRWCDKSLDNYLHAGLIRHVFPGARFICLYRHCMDVIDSGIEACPWGVRGYGFDSFTRAYPGNNVAAIAGHWLSRTAKIQAFQERFPGQCKAIRYEDLVADPEIAVDSLFSFLALAGSPGIVDRCLHLPHGDHYPGDQKIKFTDSISSRSVGRGRRVPASELPEEMREGINVCLGRLRYRPVDADWNAAIGPADPRADAPDSGRIRPAASEKAGAAGRGDTAGTVGELAQRIISRFGRADFLAGFPDLTAGCVRLVVTGDLRQPVALEVIFADRLVRLLTEADVAPAGREPGEPPTFSADAGTWRAVMRGEANMATELEAGRLRGTEVVTPVIPEIARVTGRLLLPG